MRNLGNTTEEQSRTPVQCKPTHNDGDDNVGNVPKRTRGFLRSVVMSRHGFFEGAEPSTPLPETQPPRNGTHRHLRDSVSLAPGKKEKLPGLHQGALRKRLSLSRGLDPVNRFLVEAIFHQGLKTVHAAANACFHRSERLMETICHFRLSQTGKVG